MSRRKLHSLIAMACLMVLGFLYPQPAHSASGKELSGTYVILKASSAGENVLVTMRVQLLNHTDAELTVQSATVMGMHRADQTKDGPEQQTAGPISLERYGIAEFEVQVTIDRREFESWRQGQRPGLYVTYQTADGETVHRTIPLRMGLPRGEE